MLTCTPANSISDGATTSLLSVLSILIEVLSHAHAKGKKALTFQVWHFYWSFSEWQCDKHSSERVKKKKKGGGGGKKKKKKKGFLFHCCFTSTEARWLIRDGDRVRRGRQSGKGTTERRLDRGNRPKKTGETVDRRQNNGSVKAVSPRHCPATCALRNCCFNCCAWTESLRQCPLRCC